jgi:hypothetical protein
VTVVFGIILIALLATSIFFCCYYFCTKEKDKQVNVSNQTQTNKFKNISEIKQSSNNKRILNDVLVENVKPVLVIRSSEIESESNNEERRSKYRRVIIRKKTKNSSDSSLSLSSVEGKHSSNLKKRPSSGIKFIQIKRYIKPKRKVFTDSNMQVYALDFDDTVTTSIV